MTVTITNNDEHITCYPVMSSTMHNVAARSVDWHMRIQCEACDKEHEVIVDLDVLDWWTDKYNLFVKYNGWA